MIATDPLSLLFIACFLIGLVFFIVTALLGNLGHGMTHSVSHHSSVVHTTGTHAASHGPAHTSGQTAGSHATTHGGTQGHSQTLLTFFNPTAFMIFLLGFGFFGYLFHNTIHAVAATTLILASIGGVIIAALLLMLIGRLFGDSEGETVQDVSDRTGLLGKVSITIQENSLGEIIYVSPGGMRKSIPAQSIDGRRLERDQEVVVVNYQHGIAEVDTWEHFIHEDGTPTEASASDELDKLRTLLDDSSEASIHLANDTGTSVLTRSDNAAAQLIDRHSANAAAQLANAQAECNECANAQSEREATATHSSEMQGVPAAQSGEIKAKTDSQLVMRKDLQKE